MGYRDDQDAMLARMEALERQLADAKEDLADAEADQAELADLRKKVATSERKGKAGKKGSANKSKQSKGKQSKGKQSTGRNSKHLSKKHKKLLTTALMTVAIIAGVGLIVLLTREKAPGAGDRAQGVNSLCPSKEAGPVVLIDWVSRHYSPNRGSSYSKSWFFFAVYDPETGARRMRKKIETTSSKKRGGVPDCIGAQQDLVWLWTPSDQLHARSVATGDKAVSVTDISRALGGEIHRFGFDEKTRQLVLQGKDNRSHTVTKINGTSVELKPVERFRSGLRQATKVVGMSIATVSGRRTLSDGAEVRTNRKNGRYELYARDRRLGSDWLQPQLLRHPIAGGVLWPNPPSVLVVDKPRIGAKRYTISRVSVADGKIMWSARPAKDGVSVSQRQSWQPSGDGKTLINFSLGAEMLGIDSTTGRQKFLVKM